MLPDLRTARSLRDWVLGFADFMGEVGNESWLLDIYHLLLGLRRTDSTPLNAIKEAVVLWVEIHREGRGYELQAVVCDHVDDPAFDKALEDLAAGRSPFGIFSMFRGGLKAKIEKTRIEGRTPSSPERLGSYSEIPFMATGGAPLRRTLERHRSCYQGPGPAHGVGGGSSGTPSTRYHVA
jgi:hypothetical protein